MSEEEKRSAEYSDYGVDMGEEIEAAVDEYIPSAADSPTGPRNNKDELDAIEANTREFASEEHQRAKEARLLDPFSPTNAPKLSLIVQMRIYDVLMGIYTDANPEAATRLHELHAKGGILGSLPFIDLSGEE